MQIFVLIVFSSCIHTKEYLNESLIANNLLVNFMVDIFEIIEAIDFLTICCNSTSLIRKRFKQKKTNLTLTILMNSLRAG